MLLKECVCGKENYICPIHEADKYNEADKFLKRKANDPDLHETFGLMKGTFKRVA